MGIMIFSIYENIECSIIELISSIKNKIRNFKENLDLQFAIRDYNLKFKNLVLGKFYLAHLPTEGLEICVLGDTEICKKASKLGLAFRTSEDLKEMNKNKKMIKKLLCLYKGFLVIDIVRKLLPRLIGNTLNKAGKVPTLINKKEKLL